MDCGRWVSRKQGAMSRAIKIFTLWHISVCPEVHHKERSQVAAASERYSSWKQSKRWTMTVSYIVFMWWNSAPSFWLMKYLLMEEKALRTLGRSLISLCYSFSVAQDEGIVGTEWRWTERRGVRTGLAQRGRCVSIGYLIASFIVCILLPTWSLGRMFIRRPVFKCWQSGQIAYTVCICMWIYITHSNRKLKFLSLTL